MKKIIPFLVTAITLLVAGCNRENDVTETNQLRYAKIPVSLDQQGSDPDTRSLISIESENFQNAFLVAFGSDGNVLTYQENAGDLENTGPVYIEVTEKTFDWALPINVDMDIYVLVNYTSLSDVGITLNGNLKKSDLDNLYYSCATREAFLAIDETKMPMTGIVHTRLTSYNDVLNVTVKRLFAKYEFTFNTTAFAEANYQLTAAYMRAMNCSASVPYFVEDGEGYKVTADANGVPQNVVEIMDELTEAQVNSLFSSPQPARLYFLENCQGNLGTASSWDHVYDELGEATMACATFVEIHLTATKDGKSDEFVYRVYLGKTDQKSNFDVQRNVYKQLTITLKPIIPEDPIPPGPSPFNGFSFLPGTYTVEPGGTIDIPFETNLSYNQLDAMTSDNAVLSFVRNDLVQDFRTTNATGVTRYAHSGKMRFTAANGTYGGAKSVRVKGGIVGSVINEDTQNVIVVKNYIPADKDELWVEWRLSELDGQVVQYTFYAEDTSFSGVLCFRIDGSLTVPSFDSYNRTYNETCWPIMFTNGVGTFFSTYPVDLSGIEHTFSGIVQFVSNASQNDLQGYQTVMIWPKNKRTLLTDTNTDKYPFRFTVNGVNLQGGELVNVPFKTGRTSAQISSPAAFGLSDGQEVEIAAVTYNENTSSSNLFPHSGYVTLRAKTTTFSTESVTLSSTYWTIPEYEDNVDVTLVTNSVLSINNYWMSQLNGNTMTVTFYFTANDNQFNGSLGANSNVTVTNVSNGSTIYREQDKSITLNFTNGQAEYSVSFSATGNLNFNVSRSFSATTLPSGYSSVVFN